MTRDPYADLSSADRVRARASDATLAGIVAGRLAAARALLAPPGPKAALVGRWAPVLHRDQPSKAVAPEDWEA